MGLQNLNSTQDNAAENDINSYMAMKFLHEICEKLYQFYKPKKNIGEKLLQFYKNKGNTGDANFRLGTIYSVR